ncbi:hypothetical protein ShzoTeo12_55550 (plasmid) [Shinella zoogloeoides]|nr:hypothetical protein ShzoTeo12_55550 [Shinella zoogloeoides]
MARADIAFQLKQICENAARQDDRVTARAVRNRPDNGPTARGRKGIHQLPQIGAGDR